MTAQPLQVALGTNPGAQDFQLTVNGTPYAQQGVFDLGGPTVALHCDKVNRVDLQLSGSEAAQPGSIRQGICLFVAPPFDATLTPATSMALTFNQASGADQPAPGIGGPLLLRLHNQQLANLTVQTTTGPTSIPSGTGRDFALAQGTVTVTSDADGHVTVALTTSGAQEPAMVEGELSICITPNAHFTLDLQASTRLTFRGLGSALSRDAEGVAPLRLGVKCADDSWKPL